VNKNRINQLRLRTRPHKLINDKTRRLVDAVEHPEHTKDLLTRHQRVTFPLQQSRNFGNAARFRDYEFKDGENVAFLRDTTSTHGCEGQIHGIVHVTGV
jgi:hypothetical protein